MPSLSDYDELSLDGLEIDSVGWSGSVLRANYGDGYGDEAVVGATHGLFRWKLSSGCLPDASAYGAVIDTLPRFQYYFNFYRLHTTGTQRIFVIEFRGGKYFAEFVDTNIDYEMFTIDLFAGGVEIRQRRVSGFDEDSQGAVGTIEGVTFLGDPVVFGGVDVTFTR